MIADWLPREEAYQWPLPLLVILAMVSSGLMILVYFQPQTAQQPDNAILPVLLASYFYLTGLMIVMLARVAQRAATLTARERRSGVRWDLFVMTGIDSRRYIRDSWRVAVLPMVRPWFIVCLIRVASTVFVVMTHNAQMAPGITPSAFSSIWVIALAMIVLLVVSLPFLPFAGAIGVFAAISNQRSPGYVIGTLAAWLLATLGTLLLTLLVVLGNSLVARNRPTLDYFFSPTYNTINDFMVTIGTTIMDATAFSALQRIDTILLPPVFPGNSIFEATTETTIVALLITTAILVGWTVALVRLSQWLAVRRGMVATDG